MKGLESHTKDSDFYFVVHEVLLSQHIMEVTLILLKHLIIALINVLFSPLSRYEGSIKHVKGISKEKCMSLLTELSLQKGGQEWMYNTIRIIIVCLKSANLVGNL